MPIPTVECRFPRGVEDVVRPYRSVWLHEQQGFIPQGIQLCLGRLESSDFAPAGYEVMAAFVKAGIAKAQELP